MQLTQHHRHWHIHRRMGVIKSSIIIFLESSPRMCISFLLNPHHDLIYPKTFIKHLQSGGSSRLTFNSQWRSSQFLIIINDDQANDQILDYLFCIHKPCELSQCSGSSELNRFISYPNNPTGGVVLNGDSNELLFGVDDDAGPELPGDRIEFVLYRNSPDILAFLEIILIRFSTATGQPSCRPSSQHNYSE